LTTATTTIPIFLHGTGIDFQRNVTNALADIRRIREDGGCFLGEDRRQLQIPETVEAFEELVRTEQRVWDIRQKHLIDKSPSILCTLAVAAAAFTFVTFFAVICAENTRDFIELWALWMIAVVVYFMYDLKTHNELLYVTDWSRTLRNIQNPSWAFGVPTLIRDIFGDADAQDLLFLSLLENSATG
jgi:hypothetical protein